MKLRNKKTGGIVEYDCFYFHKVNSNGHEDFEPNTKTLAELNEEWEDYEEPKEYWYITECGNLAKTDELIELHRGAEGIGNLFETKEQAEKALEKLKAWKRLKDARLEFTDFGYNLEEESSSIIGADGKICFNMLCYEDFDKDLELLFGGEK